MEKLQMSKDFFFLSADLMSDEEYLHDLFKNQCLQTLQTAVSGFIESRDLHVLRIVKFYSLHPIFYCQFYSKLFVYSRSVKDSCWQDCRLLCLFRVTHANK